MLIGDFYFCNVTFDPITQLAVAFKICEPVDCGPGPFFWASREEIIQLIKDGYTVEPIPATGKLPRKRRMLRLVEIDGAVFLRTDGERLPGDWLDGVQSQ